jgi:hypothetical protein
MRLSMKYLYSASLSISLPMNLQCMQTSPFFSENLSFATLPLLSDLLQYIIHYFTYKVKICAALLFNYPIAKAKYVFSKSYSVEWDSKGSKLPLAESRDSVSGRARGRAPHTSGAPQEVNSKTVRWTVFEEETPCK